MLLITSIYLKAQNSFEFRKRVVASTDDAEERQTGGIIDITSSDIELVNDGTTVGNQTVGLRFTNISIPKDATIESAYIQFWVDENTWTAATSVNIFGEAADNSSAFSSTGYSISSRNKTTASVAWNSIPIWTTLNAAGADQRTPDLKTLVSEIHKRNGWNPNNAFTFLITGSGRRNAHAFDGSSSMAPELIITYKLKKFPVTAFPITKNSIWMYNDSGFNLGSTWKDKNYIDTAWPFYLGKFGYGDGNEKTTLKYGSDPSNKFITSYFRKRFTVLDSTKIDSLICKVLLDDGAVVYLNGKELFRRNMPSGNITNTTTAVSSIYGNDEQFYFEHRVAAKFRNGENTIAVEVHQSDPESVDLGFDMEVIAKKPDMAVTNFPLLKASEWYYNDLGTDLYATNNWKDSSYGAETLWNYGNAPLGYGDPVTTTLGFGPNSANKYVAYFLRKKINITDTSKIKEQFFDFNFRRDDGIVVYVNGVEAFRDNLPIGVLNNRTKAPIIIDGANETTFYTVAVSKSLFKNGVNQIAVALHQRDSISSDISFDMEIVPKYLPNPVAMGCVAGQNHIACFTSIVPTAQTNKLIIPSSHNFQLINKEGEAYTKSAGNVPGNHDFTAYVPRNGSSTNGVIAINHENSPGGVSLVYTRYVDSTQLWVNDSSKSVDLYNSNLVTTIRNCSGGISPWGTVITSEESVSTADANLDGYLDIGWNVEIDPWTGKVKEYGNGKQEKLWALGRMNHENVVCAKDSITVYQGEDGGTNMVYKFIADQKMNLSSGKLYVLKLNNLLSSGEATGTTGKWIRVPNTTQADRNNCSSLALAVGGTSFNGVEDVEIGTKDNKVYFTAKGFNRTYRFKDADSTFTEFETFVGNKTYPINTGSGIVNEPWGSGNDNLTFDDQGNLWVLQDGSRNYIWMATPDHNQKAASKIELFMSPPAGSEPTGMTFTPDYKFMFMSIQHPSSANVSQIDASGNLITINKSATLVLARKEFLGILKPTVAFTADTTLVRVGKKVNFEDKSLPLIQSRVWKFTGTNDSISSSKNPSIVFNKIGLQSVKLKATNKTGSDSIEKSNYIQVIPTLPVPLFTANKIVVYENDTVQVSDVSTGFITSRKWAFVGANIMTSTDSVVKLVYTASGKYNIKLSVGNYGEDSSLIKTNYIEVLKRAPIAKFTANKTSITKGDSILLTDVSDFAPTSRKWTVVGGVIKTNASSSNVNVSYANSGKYTIKLWVSNSGGKDSLVKVDFITVLPKAPVADFTANNTVIIKNNSVTFTDISKDEITARAWVFTGGNPSSSAAANPIVSYANVGAYNVSLTATNAAGSNTKLMTAFITVNANTNINQIVNIAEFTVFPNPIQNNVNLNLNLQKQGQVQIEILDINGKIISKIYDQNLQVGNNMLSIDIKNLQLTAGTYLLNVTINNQSVNTKIIIQ
ncbi:MAG: DUF839 domain-containing protein [Bacteroidetes bacterium]|nr:DUF839 domain-containing protein [Bacteroidota bacterium]